MRFNTPISQNFGFSPTFSVAPKLDVEGERGAHAQLAIIEPMKLVETPPITQFNINKQILPRLKFVRFIELGCRDLIETAKFPLWEFAKYDESDESDLRSLATQCYDMWSEFYAPIKCAIKWLRMESGERFAVLLDNEKHRHVVGFGAVDYNEETLFRFHRQNELLECVLEEHGLI